jgi:hypothetical protein
MLSRVIGGLSEGNVQLAMCVQRFQTDVLILSGLRSAILSDVTSPATRAKALAHVGIAFAICFCIGPPIGAYFASRPPPAALSTLGIELNLYAVPAALTLVLLVAETAFLVVALPETRGSAIPAAARDNSTNGHVNGSASKETTSTVAPRESAEKRLGTLKALRRMHLLFLGVFSGVEFTLTFLTFDRKQ